MIKQQIKSVEEHLEKDLAQYKKFNSERGMYVENPHTRFELERMETYNNGVRAIKESAEKMIRDIILDIKEETPPDTITLKRIYSTHCQVCGTRHNPIEIVYFIPEDNNLVCIYCASRNGYTDEPRIYKEGE